MSTTTDPSSKVATVEATTPSPSSVTSPPTSVAPSIALPSASSSGTPAAAPSVAATAPVAAAAKPPIVGKASAAPPPTAVAGGAVARPAPTQPSKSTGATTKSAGASGKGSKRSKSKKQSPSVTMATAPTATQSGSPGGENTGRWTAEEHRLFLQGLDQHGKGWKKIASLIKSRTVVQIRTHAQKYFQKLAKARQNGEEGDVTMEGRGGGAIMGGGGVCGNGGPGHPNKKKRQLNGTKRKHISSVVSSVTTKDVKIVTVDNQAAPSVAGEAQADPPTISKGLPSVAPALAPFIVSPSNSIVDQASLTPAILEDSLYRFLTPVTGDAIFTDTVTSTPADCASAPTPAPVNGQTTTIKVPMETAAPGSGVSIGETSPTSVTDITFPTFDPKEPPQWYSKGGDVDDLLDEADTLDWLADSGDLEESYNLSSSKQGNNNPPPTSEMASLCSTSDSSSDDCDPTPTVVSVRSSSQDLVCKSSVSSASISTDNGMMSLPALFEQPSQPPLNKKPKLSSITNVVYSSATEAVEATLPSVSSAAHINDELAVFDTAFDEQAFVSALLDGSSSSNLPAATMS